MLNWQAVATDKENFLSSDEENKQTKNPNSDFLFCTRFYVSVLEEFLNDLLEASEVEQQKTRSVLP